MKQVLPFLSHSMNLDTCEQLSDHFLDHVETFRTILTSLKLFRPCFDKFWPILNQFWTIFETYYNILTRGICPSSPASPPEPQPLTRLQLSPFSLKSLPPKSSRKTRPKSFKVLLTMLSQSVQRDSQIPTEPKPASLPALPKSGPLAQRTKNNSSNSNSYPTFPPKTAKIKDKGDLLFWFKVFPTSHFLI